MTTDPDRRLQKLIRRLKSPEDVKRIHAGLLLGRMGQEATAAVPTLFFEAPPCPSCGRPGFAFDVDRLGHVVCPACALSDVATRR
jgi:hypothetical protein